MTDPKDGQRGKAGRGREEDTPSTSSGRSGRGSDTRSSDVAAKDPAERLNQYRRRLSDEGWQRLDVAVPESCLKAIHEMSTASKVAKWEIASALMQYGLESLENWWVIEQAERAAMAEPPGAPSSESSSLRFQGAVMSSSDPQNSMPLSSAFAAPRVAEPARAMRSMGLAGSAGPIGAASSMCMGRSPGALASGSMPSVASSVRPARGGSPAAVGGSPAAPLPNVEASPIAAFLRRRKQD